MATYLSSTYIPQEKRQDSNFPLLAQIMQMKQGKYDANRAKVQQTLDAFGIQAQQVLRDEDKEYISAKLSDITSQINNYGNKDLSQSSVTENLMGSIRAAASDPFIQNAIQNTQKFNRFQKEVAILKEKNPELYSDINYQYALESSGLKDYMEGKAKTIGDLTYTPYNDYYKKINDTVTDLVNKKGKRTVQQRVTDANGNPTGEIQEIEISGMSPQQLRSVATSMLSPNDLKQIEIDGWYRSGGNADPNRLTKYVEGLDDSINIYQTKVRQTTGSEKKKFESLLAQANQEKNMVSKNIDVLSKDPRALSTYLERQNVIDNIVTRFSPFYTESASIVKDDAYWAKKDYEIKLAKEQRAQNKELREQQSTQLTGNISTVSLGTGDLESLPSIEDAIQSQIDETSQNLDITLRQVKEALRNEAQNGNSKAKQQWEVLNSRIKNKKQGESDIDIIQTFITDTKASNNPVVLVNDQGENLISKFNKLSDEMLLYVEGRNEAVNKWKERHIDTTLDTEQKFKAFENNKNTTMLWKGQSVPVHQVLKQEGLMDNNGNKIGSLRDNTDVLNALVSSYYVNDIINKINEKETIKNDSSLQELAFLFNESPENVVSEELLPPTDIRRDSPQLRTIINPNTKTGQFLLQAKEQGIYDRFGFSDNSLVGDDSDIQEFIKKDYRQQEGYKQDLNRFRQKLANQQQIAFSYNENKEVFDKIVTTAQNKNPLFQRNKNGSVRVRQEGEEIIFESTDKVGTDEEQTVSQARLSIPEFQQNFPDLSRQLDYTRSSSIYTYERLKNKPLLSEPVKFVNDGDMDLFNYNREVVLKDTPQYLKYVTAKDARNSLLYENQMLTQMVPQFEQVVERTLEEAQQYGIQLKFSKSYTGAPKLNLILTDKITEEEINTMTLDNVNDADSFKEILDEAPQVYYSLLLDNIFKKQTNSLGVYQTNDSSYLKLINSLNNR